MLDGAVERRAVAGKEHVGVVLSEGGQGTECTAPVVVEHRRQQLGPCRRLADLDYGRMISFNHDFIGRDALEKTKDSVRRSKVTLVFDPEDVRDVLGEDSGFVLTYARHRVEAGSDLAGMTCQSASVAPVGTVLSLTLIDKR
ncbi:hypothetical protein [Streptomyces avermitilis]|uniref:hypothetical protein n=1 Tax=Streptomyces avermitilis TaxID=33903 RepID=UPI00157A6F69|nr:hypothetical protein [Streptomyces avermitilis]